METEPVSPELVLVDPELAERERARLREKARLAELVDISTLRRAVEAQVSPREPALEPSPWHTVADYSRRRLLPAALLCSVFASGLFAAHLITSNNQGSRVGVPVAVRTVTPAHQLTAKTTPRIQSQPSRHLDPAKAAVERRLVSLILDAPPSNLPPAFVDRTTGLVKNNVQVVCRRSTRRSFLCSARPPTEGARQGLFVRYRFARNGKGTFRWYGYRQR